METTMFFRGYRGYIGDILVSWKRNWIRLLDLPHQWRIEWRRKWKNQWKLGLYKALGVQRSGFLVGSEGP